MPTPENPFAQVDWIFEKRWLRVPSKTGRENYRQALRFYKTYLRQCFGTRPFWITDEWDDLCLLRFKQHLDRLNDQAAGRKFSSHSLTGIVAAFRQVVLEALDYGLLASTSVQNVAVGAGVAETAAHAAYSESELAQVLSAIEKELVHVRRLMEGYRPQPAGVGRDPYEKYSLGEARGHGWKVEENIRWYFEHRMGAHPVSAVGEAKVQHNYFFKAAVMYHGGIRTLYEKWEVRPNIGASCLMPLVVKLCYLTGLNPTSVLDLHVDSYREEHPLTGRPFILFSKERSGGEKELHLPLLDPTELLDREQLVLRGKQSVQVKQVIDMLLRLTEQTRRSPRIPAEIANHLLLFTLVSTNSFEEVRRLRSSHTSIWCRSFAQRYDLKADDGTPLQFNLVRFRSTKLTALTLDGRDFFEIQQVARHKSIRQTLKYVSRHQLDDEGRRVVTVALERIRANRLELQHCEPPADRDEKPIAVFRGLVADCKNVFDPPPQVTASVEYIPGQACTRYNMCLFCRNVVVTKEHLPTLVAYRDQIRSIHGTHLNGLPHSRVYADTLAVIDQLLDPKQGEFSTDDVNWATSRAQHVDTVLDPLVYRGVAE